MSQDKEREAFEAWFFDRFMVPVSKDRDGRYLYLTDRNMWDAWKARAALSHKEQTK